MQRLVKSTKQLKLALSQMSTYWQQLKEIDKNTKDLVSGYIRKSHKLNKQRPYILFQNVPICVSSLCTLYYYVTDYFDSISKHVLTSNNKKTVMSTKSCMNLISLQGSTSYGNMVIPSNSNCICKWQIAFSKIMTASDRFIIGIASTSITTTQRPFSQATYGKFYCFSPYSGRISSNASTGFDHLEEYHKWRGNVWKNRIDLELDLKTKKLSIYKYDESRKSTKNVLFHNIKVRSNIDYRLAVALGGNDISVSIVKFQQTY